MKERLVAICENKTVIIRKQKQKIQFVELNHGSKKFFVCMIVCLHVCLHNNENQKELS